MDIAQRHRQIHQRASLSHARGEWIRHLGRQLHQAEENVAHNLLAEPFGERVDRHDSPHPRQVVSGDHFAFRVEDLHGTEAPLHLPIGDQMRANGEPLHHVGLVVPSEVGRPAIVDQEDSGDHQAAASLGRGSRDTARHQCRGSMREETDWAEPTPVLVATRQMPEQITHCAHAKALECFGAPWPHSLKVLHRGVERGRAARGMTHGVGGGAPRSPSPDM